MVISKAAVAETIRPMQSSVVDAGFGLAPILQGSVSLGIARMAPLREQAFFDRIRLCLAGAG